MGKFIDLVGQVFGKWTVLYRGKSKRGAMWWCRCECGHKQLVSGNNLRRGLSTQCKDCADKAQRKLHKDIDGIEHKHCSSCKEWRPLEYYGKGNSHAGLSSWCTFCKGYHKAMRKHGGDLTLEEYIAIRCQPCVLTGIVYPLMMSVDRIDSSLPYNKDNVQPMLSPFNQEKGTRDDAEFKAIIAPVIDLLREAPYETA